MKVALAPANTDWELKLELGVMTGGEAMAGEMAAQNSAVAESKTAPNPGSFRDPVHRQTV